MLRSSRDDVRLALTVELRDTLNRNVVGLCCSGSEDDLFRVRAYRVGCQVVFGKLFKNKAYKTRRLL